MEDAVTCAVCSEVYVTGARDPLVLPCGHTLCRACVTSVKNAATEKPLSCPICRTCHPFLSIYSLPVNFSLLSLSTTYLENQLFDSRALCRTREPLTYWCRHCRTEVCGLCILTGHLRDGHSVVTTATLLEEKKEGFGSDAATVIHEARELHQKTSSHFKTALVRLMCLSVANESLLEMEDTVTTLQEKVQKAKNIDHVLMHEAHLKELLPTQKITNLLSETNISESRVPISTTRECLNVLPMPVTASVMHDPDNDTSNRSGCSAPSTNTNMSLRESFVASGFMEQSQPRTGGGTGLGG
ncbi:tripartite motif-containing protein 59-like [Penaeus monodon]|uniref:tripartite motif-containing protein 59-like n=1 Tax=Penaeus monodon TaxID=6687 RepID=UPI0018A7CEB2|nr:tripartite motif-containing protein 59-like [Penaeus monodon]